MADELRIELSELLRKAMIEQTRTSSRRALGCFPGTHGDGSKST